MRKSIAFFLLMAGTSGLEAEMPTTQIPATFVESIDVRVVNVEVYVTNKQGKRVSTLNRSDFTLFDDGKEVEITNFEVVADEADKSVPLPQMASLTFSPESTTAIESPKPRPLNLVVFVDNFNLRPQTRNRVLKQLDDFLEDVVESQDQVMIVTHDLGLQVRRPLAMPSRSIGVDIEGLNRLATRGPLTDSLTRQTLEKIQSFGCTTEASVEARSYAQQIYNETISTLSSLRRTMESLSGIDGRKALLYVSDGLPLRPGEDVFAYLAKTCGDHTGSPFDVDDISNELRRVTTAANANGVTLYTLEAAGLRGFSSVSVESMNSFQTATMDFVQNANVQDTLFNLASETGGQSVLNANDLRVQLAEIKRDLRTYYSLGYSARQTADGRIHNLRVDVKPPGFKARCRKTYRDSTSEDRMLARLDAALWHGVEENPMNVKLWIEEARAEGKKQFLVPVQVRVPLSSLTLLPNGEAFSGRFSILVSSRDPEGRFSQPQKIEIPFTRSENQMQRAEDAIVIHDLNLVMRKGDSVLALAVKDEIGGATAFIQRQMKVEKGGTVYAKESFRPTKLTFGNKVTEKAPSAPKSKPE